MKDQIFLLLFALMILGIFSVYIVCYWRIFHRLGAREWLSFLMPVPILNLFILYSVGFSIPLDSIDDPNLSPSQKRISKKFANAQSISKAMIIICIVSLSILITLSITAKKIPLDTESIKLTSSEQFPLKPLSFDQQAILLGKSLGYSEDEVKNALEGGSADVLISLQQKMLDSKKEALQIARKLGYEDKEVLEEFSKDPVAVVMFLRKKQAESQNDWVDVP